MEEKGRNEGLSLKFCSVYFGFSALFAAATEYFTASRQPSWVTKSRTVSKEKSNTQQASAFLSFVTGVNAVSRAFFLSHLLHVWTKNKQGFSNNHNKEKNSKSPIPRRELLALPPPTEEQRESHQMPPLYRLMSLTPGCSSKRVQQCVNVNS